MSWAELAAVDTPEFPCKVAGVLPVAVYAVAHNIAKLVNEAYDYEFWCSQASTARTCRVSRNTVAKVLVHLVNVGVLAVVEARPGDATLYRWVYLRSPSAGGSKRGRAPQRRGVRSPSAGGRAPQARHTVKGTENATVDEPTPSALPLDGMAAAEPESTAPTPGQLAKKLLDDYWAFIRQQTGRDPIAVNGGQFMKLVTPFLAADVSVRQLKAALKAMHESGTPLSLQSIERELNGTGRRNGRVVNTPVKALAAMTFDEAGNLVQ